MSFAYQGRVLRALRGLLGLAVALCVSAAGLTTPSRAEEMLPAMVSASAESNYGRLIVGFPERLSLPPHEISTENGVLVIQFDEQIDADVRDVTRALAGYVTVARRDPDGMALRFGLTRGVSINVMEAGEKLFVDFLPANWQGLPPGLPADVVAELAGRAEAAALRAAEEERRRLLGELNAEVALRIGRHPTFSRLSFDWNIPFATTVVREDSTIRVRFNHRVGIDLSELAADLPPLVTKVDALVGDTGLEVIVEVDDEASIRAFEDEQSYIIDVTGPRLTAPDPRLAAIEETLGGAPQPGSITVQGDRVTERPEAADEEMPAAVAETRPADGPFISDMTPEEDATPAARPVLSQARPDVGGTVQVHRRAPEVTRDAATGLNIVRAETIRVGDIIRMSFPFRNETPAAVFTRGRSLFIVFDTIVPIDMRSVRNEAAHLVRDISLTRFDGMTLIRLDLIDSIFATALPEGMRWVVTLGDAVLEPTLPLDIERAARADGRPFAEILAEGLGNVFTFKDEVVGDTIIVATIRPPARGFLKPFNFVEFSTLPSAHGIAILPRADDLRVHKGEEGHLLIEREEGLRLSEVGGSVDEFFFASVERPGFIDMDTLRDSDRGTYYEKRAELEERLSISEGEDRAQRQLDLARLAITYELGPEALGNLEIALDEQPSLEHDPAFLILMGAANVTANRPDMALRYLGDSGLRNNPDAALWRLIAYGQQGDWRAVRRVARRAQQVIDDYPVTVSGPARLTLAEAALDANAIAGVSELLGNINPARLSHDLLAHHIILSALLEDALGRRDAALSMLQQAASMDDGPENARAELERIRIQVRDEIITPQAATEALENLTTGWRGDNTEITARALLARLYVQTGDYRSAFHALKAAVMADSEADAVRELHNEMSAAFTRLFLDGEADSLPTLDALSLFYDFRELTPAGRQGDEIVRRLADRLVEVDLLDQAANLLQHQVDNRLTGVAKAQVAADLAVIYLMDHRPREALHVIQQTRLSHLPEPIEHQRRIVEARALTDLGRAELALQLLTPLSGSDVDRLRAEAYISGNKWQEAAETLERMMGERWSDTVPLAEAERLDVLRAAIAYSLAGDGIGLDRLRRKFAAKMSDSPHARAFDVVSAPIETRGIEFREVARQIASVDTMRQFLSDYRSQYAGPPVTEEQPAAATPAS